MRLVINATMSGSEVIYSCKQRRDLGMRQARGVERRLQTLAAFGSRFVEQTIV